MFVDFFIKRPIFATVCSLIIILAGAVCIPTLPIAQYPQIALPQVTVTSHYTGASAEVVESGVTTPLELELNGVEGMKYMTSTSSNDGTSTITLTFDLSRNIDNAIVDVQNRISTVQGRLPNEVKLTGVVVAKNSTSIIMALGLYSEHGEYDNLYISNYADRYLKDALKRVKGVGSVQIFGERKYSMRMWLDPNRLASRGLTALDVVKALQDQNVQVAAGQIGQQPSSEKQMFQISVRALGRLQDAKQFDNIMIKSGGNGALVRLKDVGHAELGAEDYSTFVRFKGHQAVGLGINQLQNANALEVDKGVQAALAKLAQTFPPGLKYSIAFDPTVVVGDSIREVIITLVTAIILVIAVIFIFLQEWKTTLIPAFTIPVSLIGTFIFVKLLGFSINTLTLFGLTLATGLVVDDAIVVIENIARFVQDKSMSPAQAASEGMKEVFSAVVATSLVLIAVFVPVAFFPGTTGQLYKQFALTISFSIALSAFNALTLTPALSALLLGSHVSESNWFFRPINRGIEGFRNAYKRALPKVTARSGLAIAFFLLCLGATYWLFQTVPSGFVPTEDQGYFIITMQGPEGSSLQYMTQQIKKVEAEMDKEPDIFAAFAVGGFSFTGAAPNKASIFPCLMPLDKRSGASHSMQAVLGRLAPKISQIPGAIIVPFPPPSIQGVGNFGGFQFEVLDQSDHTLATLASTTDKLVGAGNTNSKSLRGLFSSFTANDPQLVINLNRERIKALNVPLNDIFSTLQVFLGSQYINDFDFLNRIYRVYVQADTPFRSNPKDIEQFYVRSTDGNMIPLSNLITVKQVTSPQIINHYNLFRSTEINGSPAPGYSSGQAMMAMQQLAQKNLPTGMGYDWSGISLEQIESGSQAIFIFALGIVFVYLVLAAQYESFLDPLIILLAVPLAILGALMAQSLRGLENDVFCQIGLVMLIGLASKNAILIVEFANQLREKGASITQAAIISAQTRFRPIIMTSLAFILGILPLVFATGAGAASRRSLGTAVFGGMIVSTLLSLFIVPVLYIALSSLRACVLRQPDTGSDHPVDI